MLYFEFDDQGVTRRVPLRDGTTIGRATDNEVLLADFSVSRHHARVEGDEGGSLRIVDLESTNGIKIGGEFVTEAVLAPGTVLDVGSFRLTVVEGTGDVGSEESATFLRPLDEFKREYGLELDRETERTQGGEGTRVLAVLAEVSKTLLEVEELSPVLEKVMDLIFGHLAVDRGFILLDDGTGTPQLELFRSRQTVEGEPPPVPLSRTILDTVMRDKVAVLTHDAQADVRFESRKSIRIHQIRSAMCVPLWHRDRVIGVIYVDSPLHVGSFSASDLDLLTALANSAAVAIEQARLREKIRREQEVRRRLERYHSPAVIDAVLSGPSGVAPEATLCEATVLFADIVGFTPRCERLAPTEVAGLLNEYFSLAVDAVFAFGGTLDKFIGDAVMAFFGAPLPQPDHAERAVRAAIALRQALVAWNRRRALEGLDQVEVRLALNTGPVIVGEIGSQTRVDYTVLGNAVNVAARLEELVAQPGEIILGERTHASVAYLFPTEHRGNFRLKGLSRETAAYRLKVEEMSGPSGSVG
ncbi:MAG: GAF domain-containing protein [Acidobacteria bacterium]|nr:GAF domain-containing protein [Acidobacteriota bacterium]